MKVCVVGGGAAGMTCAIALARAGAEVDLLEKNEKLGKKMYITGKGRCNLTNDCDAQHTLENVIRGKKFLKTAVFAFDPAKTIQFFEDLGLEVVVERGNRVFPKSQKSSDVIAALKKELLRLGVNIYLQERVTMVEKKDKFVVYSQQNKFECDCLVVACGGMSYPLTGSTGDGYKFAKLQGHTIVQPVQALVPIHTVQDVSALEGLSLKNVQLKAYDKSHKLLGSEFGEMMFTKHGVTGPIALTISSYINRAEGVRLVLDLKPALDKNQLDARILRDFAQRSNQDLKNVTRGFLPERLNLYVLRQAGIDADKKVNVITKQERVRLTDTIKELKFDVKRLAGFEEAIITSGGVSLDELTPYCESKLVEGLYFIGETIDVDALTGGFNLQLSFSTAMACARSIQKKM